MADVEGLPVHTWGRHLAKVKLYAVEALSLHLGVPEAEVSKHITFERPQLLRLVSEALDRAETVRADADSTPRAWPGQLGIRSRITQRHLAIFLSRSKPNSSNKSTGPVWKYEPR